MTKFTIECTLPPEGKTFVEAPNARGTLNIVYSCLAVLVLCTWGVQHLNVPPQTVPKGWQQRRVRALLRVLTKVKWMTANVLAPELPFAQAVCGLVNQYQVRKSFDRFKECDEVQWTGTHTQLANMGGFVVRFDQRLQNSPYYMNAAEQNEHAYCVVDEYCCNRPDMISPRSIWNRTHMRSIGKWIKRSNTSENKPVAMRSPSLNIDLSSDIASFSPPEERSANRLGHPALELSDRHSFAQTILAEDYYVVSPPVCVNSDYTTSEHEMEADLRSTFARVFRLLRVHCRYGWGCPHDMSTSPWSGETKWKLDANNLMVARATIATLDIEYFTEEGIADKFLFASPTSWLTNLGVLCGNRWSLDANQLLLARRFGIIDKLPSVTEDEIDDLNKSDIFVKTLAVVQILWLCIQLCERLKRHLPTTQLEVVTLAFAICSILTYVLLHSRPKDVQTVHEIDATRYPTPSEITQIAAMGPSTFGFYRKGIAIPNNSYPLTNGWYFTWSTITAMIIFGALHVVSWSYEFPTRVERTLWRASIVATIIAMPVIVLIALLTRLSFGKYLLPRLTRAPRFRWIAISLQFYLVLPIFVAARLFIIVEVVRSLAYQPPEAFRSTWAAELPSVG